MARIGKALSAILLCCGITAPVLGGKAMIYKNHPHVGANGALTLTALNEAALSRFGTILVRYPDSYLLNVQDAMRGELETWARSQAAALEFKNDFDRVRINGYEFASGTTPTIPPELMIQDYTGEVGLYVVQFIGNALPAWHSQLRLYGQPVMFLPENTFVVRARPADRVRIAGLSFVQHVSVFQPAFKVAPGLQVEMGPVDATIELDPGQDIRPIATILESFLINGHQISESGQRFVAVRITSSDAATLAMLAQVLWVEQFFPGVPSGERVALATAGEVNATKTAPVGPGTYSGWLRDRGFCTKDSRPVDCLRGDAAVAVFDTGVDKHICSNTTDGGTCSGPSDVNLVHWDLAGREVRFFCVDKDGTVGGGCLFGQTRYYSDPMGHGTAVTSILAGDPDCSGPSCTDIGSPGDPPDPGDFEIGAGIAPAARIVTFRTWVFDPLVPDPSPDQMEAYYKRLVALPASDVPRFTNNSWNIRSIAPTYGSWALAYDRIVRDADPDTPGLQQTTVVFAAGNCIVGEDVDVGDGTTFDSVCATSPAPGVSDFTLFPPANSKNVISVGASENFRRLDNHISTNCQEAESLKNIASFSRRGVSSDNTEEREHRIKPDLVVPATRVGAAWTRQRKPRTCCATSGCYDVSDSEGRYTRFWGTSSAAPVVAGATVLADGWYQSQNGGLVPPPSMLKAMLVAHAADLRGGLPKTPSNPNPTPLPARPTKEQGWGRVELGPLLDSSARHAFVPEDHSAGGPARFSAVEVGTWWYVPLVVADPTKEVIVTLAYTDAPGASSATGRALVNDLDLYLTVAEDTIYPAGSYDDEGYSQATTEYAPTDTFNNVEVLKIRPNVLPPGEGLIGLAIFCRALNGIGVPIAGLDNGQFNQDFAVYAYNVKGEQGFVASPLTLPKRLAAGQTGTESITLHNNNGGVSPARYQLTENSPWLTLSPTSGSIPANGSVTVTASFAANQAPRFGLNIGTIRPWYRGVSASEPISVYFTKAFDDVPAGHWAGRFIDSVAGAGIPGPLATPNLFSPTTVVTRREMAYWLVHAKHGGDFVPPDCQTAPFTDVPVSDAACPYVALIKQEGIAAGCDVGLYCPDGPVTREEMAVFLLATKEGQGYAPPACRGLFADVPCDRWSAAWVEELYERDITAGCDIGLYCPTLPIPREEMSVFVAAMWNLPLAPQ